MGAFSKLRGLGQDDSQVQTHILRTSPTHGLHVG
jgi:hypothetical protein